MPGNKRTPATFGDTSKGGNYWRYQKLSKADWADAYADLYRQVYGDITSADEVITDAENRTTILKRYRAQWASQPEDGPETEDISAGRHYDGPEDDSTRLTSDGRWWDGEKWIDAYQDGAFRVYHSEDGDSFPYGVEVWNGEKRKWVQLRSSYSDGMHLLRFMSQGEAEDWVTTQLANVPF